MKLDMSSFLSGLEKASQRVLEGAMDGLLVGGEMVLGVSNDQVPHEDGDLERTGAVSSDAEARKVAISYRDVAYPGQAEQQHEDMTLNHDEGRNAKFLENALNTQGGVVLEAVAGGIRRKIGGA